MGAIVPYGIQSYTRADLPQVRLVNMYAEAVPASPAATALFPRPGMEPVEQIGTGPVYGLFQQPGQFSGDRFTVSGSRLYRSNADAGDVAASGRVQFASLDAAMLLVSGSKLWRYDDALTQVAFPDDAGVTSVVYLGGYAVASRAGSRRLYFALDSTTWDGLDYVSAEQSTEAIVGLSIVVDQLWVFCERHTEIFYLTGDSDAPLQRVQGRVFDKGARSRDSICRFDNSVIWTGQDSVVYRGDNTPIRVSDHGIEELILASSTVAAWSYSWFGHLFYVLQLDAMTLVYDAATKQWHETASYQRPRWCGAIGIQNDSEVLVGDDASGRVYRLTDAVYTDADQPMQRIFTVLLPDPQFADTLTVDCSRGILPTPAATPGALEMRTSRDSGQTFTAWRQTSLGEQGRYRRRAGFNRLGLIDQDGMVVQFRLTDPVVARVSAVQLNDNAGGRSR